MGESRLSFLGSFAGPSPVGSREEGRVIKARCTLPLAVGSSPSDRATGQGGSTQPDPSYPMRRRLWTGPSVLHPGLGFGQAFWGSCRPSRFPRAIRRGESLPRRGASSAGTLPWSSLLSLAPWHACRGSPRPRRRSACGSCTRTCAGRSPRSPVARMCPSRSRVTAHHPQPAACHRAHGDGPGGRALRPSARSSASPPSRPRV